MKIAKKQNQGQKRSKLGEIRMISNSSNNSKNMSFNSKFKKSTKSKASLTHKTNADLSSLPEEIILFPLSISIIEFTIST